MLHSITNLTIKRASVVDKMSAKRGLIALGAAMVSAAAVARYMVLSQGNKRDDLKARDISKSELMTETKKKKQKMIRLRRLLLLKLKLPLIKMN